MPSNVLATYPLTLGKPDDIKQPIEYYYLLNRFQFAFQNYCAGNTSKDSFYNDVKDNLWNLADTIYLSRKPIRCGISVMGGLQSDSIPVYIIDANNNNDYSDEVVRHVRKGIRNPDTIISLSIPVTMDVFLEGKICKETVACYISSANPGNQLSDLSFCFPAFRFNSFVYGGKPYILWTPINSFNNEFFFTSR